MTPAEARQIDQEEFAAECAAARQRARIYVAECRQRTQRRIDEWLGRAPEAKMTWRTDNSHTHAPKTITVNNETRSIKEWAEHLGISTHGLYTRKRRYGTFEAAINMAATAAGPKPKLHTLNGESLTLQQWADRLGMTKNALKARIKRRGSLEAAVTLPDQRLSKQPETQSDHEHQHEHERQTVKQSDSQSNSQTPGVSKDFLMDEETGAHSTARETPENKFSMKG